MEEHIAVRLGLERLASREELVARVRSSRILGDADARALGEILASLSRLERGSRWRPGRLERKPAELLALVERARGLVAAMDASAHDRVGSP